MKKAITVILVVILALGLGYFLFSLSPHDQNNGSNGLSDTETQNISEPRPIGAGDYVLGNSDAKNTMIIYEDFECPACASFAPIAEQIPASLQDTKLVFRHFPLPYHTNGLAAALAAEAAGAQGKFWEMYHVLYSEQDQWVNLSGVALTDKFAQIAQQAGVPDIEKFRTDMKNQDGKDKIQADYSEAMGLKVGGTPTLYFNGKPLQLGNMDSIKNQVEPLYIK